MSLPMVVCDGVLRVLLDWDSLVLSRSCTSGMYSVFTYNTLYSILCFIDGYGVCHQPSVLTFILTYLFRNKWVLNNTDVPLFFLCCQLVIAVILFLVAHTLGLLKLPLEFDLQVCKGLIPMVGLNVIGLRYVHTAFLNSYLQPSLTTNTTHNPHTVSATTHSPTSMPPSTKSLEAWSSPSQS